MKLKEIAHLLTYPFMIQDNDYERVIIKEHKQVADGKYENIEVLGISSILIGYTKSMVLILTNESILRG